MAGYVKFYSTDAKTGKVTEAIHYLTQEEKDAIAEASKPVIPSTVSMRQARLALLQSGLLETVNTSLSGGSDADKITWEYATEVRRDDALVTNLSAALNLKESDLDNLFTLASSL